MVVYAASVDVSVGRMFLAGVIPGILAGAMLMLAIYIVARVKNLPAGEWKGFGELAEAVKMPLGPVLGRHYHGRYLWRCLYAD